MALCYNLVSFFRGQGDNPMPRKPEKVADTFTTPQLVSLWNNVWWKSAEIPYWSHVTTYEVKCNRYRTNPKPVNTDLSPVVSSLHPKSKRNDNYRYICTHRLHQPLQAWTFLLTTSNLLLFFYLVFSEFSDYFAALEFHGWEIKKFWWWPSTTGSSRRSRWWWMGMQKVLFNF